MRAIKRFSVHAPCETYHVIEMRENPIGEFIRAKDYERIYFVLELLVDAVEDAEPHDPQSQANVTDALREARELMV